MASFKIASDRKKLIVCHFKLSITTNSFPNGFYFHLYVFKLLKNIHFLSHERVIFTFQGPDQGLNARAFNDLFDELV